MNSYSSSASPTDFAWLAGLIDGDGTFYSTTATGTNGKKYHILRLVIAMNHKATIEYIADKFGGTCNRHSTNTTRQKQMWFWRATGDHLRTILIGVLPFLVTKKAQAIVVNELMELRRQSTNHGIFQPERQAELFQVLRDLNKRWTEVDTTKGARSEFLQLIGGQQ